MYVPLKFVSKEVSESIARAIASKGGFPTENRVLILSPKNQEVKVGNILLPQTTSKDTIPNKGVVILRGEISEEYRSYKELINIGSIVTYGIYAGKEIEFNPEIFNEVGIELNPEENGFSVLSLTEIIFTEHNTNK